MKYLFMSLFLIAAAIFCIYCAYKDMDWFMNNRKAVPFVKMFGRNGARIFYIGLGVFIGLMGILCLISSIKTL